MAADNLYESLWPEEQAQYSRTVPAQRTLPNRACAECRRKKSKCDMKRPECSLCHRIGETCVYPTRRAPGRKRAMAQPNHQNMICYDSSMQENNIYSPPISSSSDPFFTNDSFFQMGFPILNTTEQLRALSDADEVVPWPEEQDSNGMFSPLAGTQGVQSTYGGGLTPGTVSTTQPRPSSPTMKRSTLFRDSGYSLSVHPDTALDLITGFFNNIHCFLPLFHPARFKAKYASLAYLRGEPNYGLSLESAFTLNGMFSLCARFSMASEFSTEEPVHRGDKFVAEATSLSEVLFKQLEDGPPSLATLQGIILLTYSALLSGPSRRAWWLCGVCARLAYELDLHNTDADIICGDVDPLQLSLEAWQDREERRRAWWIVWDMDTFASANALRPFAVNRHTMQVLLPISDKAWLASDRVPSSHLDPGSTTPWKGLCDSPNQNTWAWFLACTVLLRQVIEALLSPTKDRVLDQVEASLGCFALALPERFRADLDSMRFDDAQSKDGNWVMATLLLFNCCEMQLALYKKKPSAPNTLRGQMPRNDSFSSSSNSPSVPKNDSCDGFRKEMAQVARTWPAQNLAQTTPFIAICLAGPAVVYLRGNRQLELGSLDDLNLDILIFALKRLARHWKFASVLLGKVINQHMSQGKV